MAIDASTASTTMTVSSSISVTPVIVLRYIVALPERAYGPPDTDAFPQDFHAGEADRPRGLAGGIALAQERKVDGSHDARLTELRGDVFVVQDAIIVEIECRLAGEGGQRVGAVDARGIARPAHAHVHRLERGEQHDVVDRRGFGQDFLSRAKAVEREAPAPLFDGHGRLRRIGRYVRKVGFDVPDRGQVVIGFLIELIERIRVAQRVEAL